MDTRDMALGIARGRAIIGLGAIVLPGATNRFALGQGPSTPWLRAVLRMLGVRDLLLGIGALTSVKEATQGPEWLSMGAVADAFDALVCLTVPGATKRTRLVGVAAAASAIVAMKVSRDLADERAAGSGIEPGA